MRCLAALPVAFTLLALPAAAQPVAAQVDTCFTPAERCDARIIAAIDAARSEIRVQAYGFTAAHILGALAAAKRRGVDVQLILDKTNDRTTSRARYSGAVFAENAGIPVWIDDEPAIAHNKLIIVDRREIVGGSYNYTASAETRNAENVTFIDSPDLAERFLRNWTSRQKVSRRLGPDEAAAGTPQGAVAEIGRAPGVAD